MDKKIILKCETSLYYESEKYLFDLYLPFATYKAIFLYLYLRNCFLNGRIDLNLNDLLIETSLNEQDYLLARRSLESSSLIKTYQNENTFLIFINSPLEPNDFFNNEILKNLLLKSTNEKYINEVINKYQVEKEKLTDFEEISAKFSDSYEISINHSSKLDRKFIGKNKNTFDDGFDEIKFTNLLTKRAPLISKNLTDKDINTIHNLVSLYGLNYDEMINIVIDGYKVNGPDGEKLDLEYVNNRAKLNASYFKKSFKKNTKQEKTKISSETELALKIKKYEETNPRLFLKEINRGVDPVIADLNILEMLKNRFDFSNGIINCLIEFVVLRFNGDLNKSYIEKLASNMKRSDVNNTLSAINYLHKPKKINESYQENTKLEKNNKVIQNVTNVDNDEEEEEVEFDFRDLWKD